MHTRCKLAVLQCQLTSWYFCTREDCTDFMGGNRSYASPCLAEGYDIAVNVVCCVCKAACLCVPGTGLKCLEGAGH